MKLVNTMGAAALCAVCGMVAPSALAGPGPGLYQLANHPDGAEAAPFYGLRLDELYDATEGHDVFSFDFEADGSAMFMRVTESAIRIFGQSWGGRDTGGDYANDEYLGFYEIDFLYSMGVDTVPGDDDLWVDAPNHSNFGSIRPVGGDISIPMTDERGEHPFSFRLGDEDDDQGHRGYPGLSGWGWMNHGDDLNHHEYSSDWLFTGRLVPTPGSAGLLLAAGAMAARRRRN